MRRPGLANDASHHSFRGSSLARKRVNLRIDPRASPDEDECEKDGHAATPRLEINHARNPDAQHERLRR